MNTKAESLQERIKESLAAAYYPERLLRIKEVLSITGLSRSRLYVLIKEGKFSAPIPLGEDSRAVAWIASEVNDWVARQIGAAGRSKRVCSCQQPTNNEQQAEVTV